MVVARPLQLVPAPEARNIYFTLEVASGDGHALFLQSILRK
jgi:hypothetical protein